MSDTKLRDLELRWKQTGTVDDEAAYLLERVRVGDLTRERLELAAYCGHEAAGRALGAKAPPSSFVEWGVGMAPHGRHAVVRAAVAVASAAASESSNGQPDESRRRTVELASMIEAWTDCPCHFHRTESQNTARELSRLLNHPQPIEEPGDWVLTLALLAADMIVVNETLALVAMRSLIDITEQEMDVSVAFRAARTALLPWALAPRGSST